MESTRSWSLCTKNPGHEDFIPYPDFRPDHLPAGWRTPEKIESVRIMAEITVRLRVNYTSFDRPDGFAFCNSKGSTSVHTGSGWIHDVRYRKDVPCPCSDCATSLSPQPEWTEIVVVTAAHVVYNTEEAQATAVDLFYDDERSRRNGRMKTAMGSEVKFVDVEGDTCLLSCATHDTDLNEKLQELRPSAAKTFAERNCFANWRPTVGNVCVIISHPHGKPKQITIGQVKATQTTDGVVSRLSYSACTCPGSSGAVVLPMDAVGAARPARSAVHSLGRGELGLNHSSAAIHHYRPRYDKLFNQDYAEYSL